MIKSSLLSFRLSVCLTLGHKDFLLFFPPLEILVLGLVFSVMIHFELISVYAVWHGVKVIAGEGVCVFLEKFPFHLCYLISEPIIAHIIS